MKMKTLVILEVSRKQDYIFSSKRLRDNVRRSAEINHVTSEAFFQKAAGKQYHPENMVYSGGGDYGQPFIHLGPVCLRDQETEGAALMKIFGQRFAQQVKKVFG